MRLIPLAVLVFILCFPNLSGTSQSAVSPKDANAARLFGFQNSADEVAWENRFLAAPDSKLAAEHAEVAEPHLLDSAFSAANSKRL